MIVSLINKEAFQPTALGIFLNPFFLARREIYKSIDTAAKKAKGKVLDVGCGSMPYKKLFRECDYVGIEYDTPIARQKKQADFYYSGYELPFPCAEFDVILCTQVLEHVFEPDKFLSELRRIAKVGAKLVLTVPFVWDEHEQPYDFARYSSFGLKDLIRRNGWEIVHFEKLNGGMLSVLQLANGIIYKRFLALGPKLGFLLASLFCIPFNLVGLILRGGSNSDGDLYLDNFVVAERLENF